MDVRYAGTSSRIDWDLEGMAQGGTLGPKRIRAGSLGALIGSTFEETPWQPRIGLQADASSGNSSPTSDTIETFNPLFPNGYYVTLSGFTGDTNLLHLKPSISVKPIPRLKLAESVGLLWRANTADAVYLQPDIPVSGTAGRAGRWTGLYDQVTATYAVDGHLTTSLEVDYYAMGGVIHEAGGHNGDYVGAELKYGW
jgi:hypothetical protein